MSKRLIGGFGIAVALLLALSASATAQKRTTPVGGGVVPLNFNSNQLSTPSLFVDVAGNRVCGLQLLGPVTVHCEPLPIVIPAGAPVVPLNQFDTNLRYFVVGEGIGFTQFCAVTSNPIVGTTVCSTNPF